MWHGPQKNVIVNPALFKNLWQRSSMAETVYIETCSSGDAKFLLKVALRIQPVADKRFPCWNITIGLYPPAADDPPTSFLYTLLDLSKHRRIRFLHPFVEGGGTG